ncbi:DinB family protein [Neobacillus sp. PS3-34]|uniref:DinB family protein n=1 Tax=Neobacillus sp. PS3-34 TaxID=3070678 RepID=UPI0027E003F9|nr:DinB family protein [Neobacillus sp. PS3-34]WML48602.1 DinB family protein [Neobacillus sp. PS3-34]
MKNNKEVREEILLSVSGLTDAQLNEKPNGMWSIMQVLEHLYLTERTIVYQMMRVMANDEESQVENKPIHLALNRTNKFVAPSFLTPSVEFTTLDAIKAKLLASRTALEAFVTSADEEKMLKRSFPNPIFGLIHVKQWVEFIGFHEERHLAQIEEVKQELGFYEVKE